MAQDTSLECVSVCVCGVSGSSVQCAIGELIGVSRHSCYLPPAILFALPLFHCLAAIVCACACVCVCVCVLRDGEEVMEEHMQHMLTYEALSYV